MVIEDKSLIKEEISRVTLNLIYFTVARVMSRDSSVFLGLILSCLLKSIAKKYNVWFKFSSFINTTLDHAKQKLYNIVLEPKIKKYF